MTEKIYVYDGKSYSTTEINKVVTPVDEKTVQKLDQRGKETIKMIEGRDVLDVGCSIGDFSKILALKGHKVYSIDILETSIEIARDFNSHANITYEVRDLLKKPFPENSFDCVIFTETIEHVDNPAQYLREFHRILRTNGHLVLSTPNATSLKNVLYALSHRKKEKRNRVAREIVSEPRQTGTQLEHIYNWDFPTLVRLLDRTDFELEDHAYVRSGPIILPFFKKKFQIINLDSNILRKFEPLMTTIIIKAKKRAV